MTKKELVTVREVSYRGPPAERCETCTHFAKYGSNCLAVTVRDRVVMFAVHPAGKCDLWVAKTPATDTP